MKRLFLLFLICSCALPLAAREPWSALRTPTPGPARSIGVPAGGCLAGGVALPPEGPGYQVARLARHRYFGHPDLVAFVQALGEETARRGWPPLLVGDLSHPRGGPAASGHRSHQSGRDVDLFYLAPTPPLTPPLREDPPMISLLTPDGRGLDPARWDELPAALVALAASRPGVERLFVHPRVKEGLCRRFPDAPWQPRVRPWRGHDVHFHIRMRCPRDDADCVSGAPPLAPGSGCDALPEEGVPAIPPSSAPLPLPAVCDALLLLPDP